MRSILAAPLLAITLLSPAVNATDVALDMGSIAAITNRLYPLLLSDKAPTPAEREQMKTDVAGLRHHMESVGKSLEGRPAPVQLTYRTMMKQLKEGQAALLSGQTDYSQRLLQSTTTLCAACHTQDHVERTGITSDTLAKLPDDFARGEFLFMTRQYQPAIKAYEEFLLRQPKLFYTKKNLSALDRLQVLTLDLAHDPETLSTSLKAMLKIPQEKALTRDVTAWIEGIDQHKSLLRYDVSTDEQLRELVTQWVFKVRNTTGPIYIEESQRPLYVWLRGQLHRAAYQHGRNNTAEILYWLAICDRVLEYRFYYSLADQYLTQCIESAPKQPAARQCLAEYEQYINFAYSGSGGTEIPGEVKAELDRLRKLTQ